MDNFGDIQTNLPDIQDPVDNSLHTASAAGILNSLNRRGWFIEPAGYPVHHKEAGRAPMTAKLFAVYDVLLYFGQQWIVYEL